ncbi:MAG: hypothetical protein CHACPFDD_01139 [Phycisphaerae bacterium]|nr:hypothetical protein [Phycisphaerae bacterium]
MKTRSGRMAAVLSFLVGWGVVASATAGDGPLAALDEYDVIWTSPSADSSGSMPSGNGELGLNVWVEPGGDLVMLIARSDAWSEACRLTKLGRLRISLTPNPLSTGAAAFRQRLHLRDGRIAIELGSGEQRTRLEVFVDSRSPVVHVAGDAATPLSVKARVESWRTERKRLTGKGADAELTSSWTMHDAPDSIEVWESADRFEEAGAVTWYHRNEHSIVPLTLNHQGLEASADRARDPLLHRTFGGTLDGDGFERIDAATIQSSQPMTRFALRLTTHAAQTESAEQWIEQLRELAGRAAPPDAARAEAQRWWNAFWQRSWIFVDGDRAAASDASARDGDLPPCPSPVTRGYVLSRWMQACAGRGAYPIKFNGSIFNVEPVYTSGATHNADYRRWGDGYWWQNMRLPLHGMAAAGDWEMMLPLFRVYEEALPLCRARAASWYGARGAYFPETMSIFGTYSNGDYGWDRTGHAPGEVLCPWWQYAWNQGPELLALMLDYWDYTRDEAFARQRVVPMAAAVLEYFDSRFSRDAAGKLRITPTQALETHWYDVVNDMPTVAGLHAVLPRLRSLPPDVGSTTDRALWDRLAAALPPLPTREEGGVRMLAAAESFKPTRQNVETPELYAVFPFRLIDFDHADAGLAREAYARRHDKMTHGWTQDGQFAALLGLTDEARANILAKAGNSHAKHRFPAMWGPNFDWLPDQCHNGNLMSTLQLMLIQCDGRKIVLLPAWPRDWNVSFKLHAPGQTTVEGEFRDGTMQKLVVTPEGRRADVTVCEVR